MVKGLSVDADAGWNPLILSTIAGMSTCLGALIVFCHPIEDDDDDNVDGAASVENANKGSETKKLLGKKMKLRVRGRRKVRPSTMAFSLALAGSVMVTVSVVSIGPECLAASSMPQNLEVDEENSFFVFGITLMPILSWAFLERLLSFGLGCLLYFLMSKYAFPEPEEILAEHSETLLSAAPLNMEMSNYPISENNIKQNTTANSSRSSNLILRRAGSNGDLEMTAEKDDDSIKNKGPSRGSPSKRAQCCSHPFTSCMSQLRTFTTGSDLQSSEARRANRVAMLLFFSLLIHNFPEGLAVAASALESDQLGLTVTVGIMIHNIPEGIAIAIPCLKARPDSPWLCFILASVSGLAEPAGAFISLMILRGVGKKRNNGEEDGSVESGTLPLENVLAFVAGIMITVSLLELFPEGRRHAEKSSSMSAYYGGIVIGFIVMVATEFGMSL